MLKLTNRVHEYFVNDIVCDQCKQVIGEQYNTEIPIEWTPIYYHSDGVEDRHFCSFKCLLEHLKNKDEYLVGTDGVNISLTAEMAEELIRYMRIY